MRDSDVLGINGVRRELESMGYKVIGVEFPREKKGVEFRVLVDGQESSVYVDTVLPTERDLHEALGLVREACWVAINYRIEDCPHGRAREILERYYYS